ncbi:hypothetical protein OEB99_17755 [Actinotalea sp. M2MS4P-6]|uniref:hypothetical protein n=1 Tax=Actinotalea sp. M2MS4P-6 TaxID=2983762 RepID=UPI0021E4262C|nr:hypothetical protein [Actinotalea sp. M2MS4P-6]MCV2396163.1 hypothetical protein [Actinotalea sp. M2MS4P-6]
MPRRAVLAVTSLVLGGAAAIAALRLATGADAASALVSALGCVLIVGGSLGANQWIARRRARR